MIVLLSKRVEWMSPTGLVKASGIPYERFQASIEDLA
jgi:hypothetical protein